MAEQKQVQKARTEQAPEVSVPMPQTNEKTEVLKADLDDLLDEIDSVLEETDFAVTYRQQGGE